MFFNTLKVNYDKVIQVNNEFKVNVNDQQVDKKHFKEQCDIDDEDKVQQTTMKKNPHEKE